MIRALGKRDFALLWLGGLISMAGDWVLAIGLPIYVFLLTHSVLATGLTLLAGRAPSILLGSVAGVFVDRWNRKRTLVVTNVLLALALVPALLVTTPDLVWIVYAVVAVETSLEQFTNPAQNALLPALVEEERLVAANSLNSLSSNLARLGGPALGGLIAAVWGLDGIVLADAASFLGAALLFTFISSAKSRPQKAPETEESLAKAEVSARARGFREWMDGLRMIARSRVLRVLFLALAFTGLGEGIMGTLYPVFVNLSLHGVALQIGQLMSAQAVGGLIGGLLAGWLGERILNRGVLGVSAIVFGMVDLAIFNAPALLPTLLPASVVPIFSFEVGLFVAVGIPGIWMLTGAQSLLQMSAPDAYRGRVFGVLGMVLGLLGLVGIIAASTLADRLGVVTLLNIQGAGYIVAGLLLLWLLPRGKFTPAVAVPTPIAVERTGLAEDLLDPPLR